MPQKIAAGNWKMNGTLEGLQSLASLPQPDDVNVLICPPATLIAPLRAMNPTFYVGAQDCHQNDSGAHTGDLSATMLRDAGARFIILGHSERRTDHGETNELVAQKAWATWRAGLNAIICVGETLEQREAGETLAVLDDQLNGSIPDESTFEDTIIAYEPVWAIGTGKVPTIEQITEVHDHIRAQFPDHSLLYGGSVKGSNAAEIFSVKNVDGALVGGASLKPEDFAPIIDALAQS